MINNIINFFKRKKEQTTDIYVEPKCSECGGSDFMSGPEGGMSVNIMCDKCHSAYNYTPSNLMGGRSDVMLDPISNDAWKNYIESKLKYQ